MVADAPTVSVFIPTYNRSRMVVGAAKSVLAQNHPDFQVVVIDDASTDDTGAAVASLADPRLKYVRNGENLGLYRNWVRALDMNPSPYVCILPDDDSYLPGFVERSVDALNAHPGAAFSSSLARRVDVDDRPLASQEPRGAIATCIEGLEYLHQIVSGKHWVIHPATVMMRASAVRAVGGFDPVHSATSFDFNLYVRLGARFDVVFLDEELAQVRVHGEQVSHHIFNVAGATGPLTTHAELIDAALFLLGSERGTDDEYRQWLARRLDHLSLVRSQVTAELIPELNLSWDERVRIATDRIAQIVPAGAPFVLADEGQWDVHDVAGRRPIPLIERDGRYWGPPANDDAAIDGLQNALVQGARTVVFGWPAFWWFEHFAQLNRYLDDNYRRVADNSLIVVFQAREMPPVVPS